MQDKPFKLDRVSDLPRYVSRDSYQSVLEDKSGYDHILLADDSRTFLASSGVGGISPTIRYRLAGRFHRTFIITLPCGNTFLSVFECPMSFVH